MKWKTTLGITLAGVMLVTAAWTHHAAEGIISDEIWVEIDERLDLADSPHLIIFEDIMGSMRIDEAAEGGSMFLISSITVGEDVCDDYVNEIQGVLDDEELEWVHGSNCDDDSAYHNTFMPVIYEDESGESCICENGECTIALWEPIGSIGWSDDADEIYSPPETPGPTPKPKGN